ncbi:MAG: AbrB/MazE/SpoVT family DNA-binding domain-containing protein, partial [Bacteroidota bacterium]
MTLTIDKFGRVLIPKTLRELLTVQPGDKVEVKIDSERPALLISPLPPEPLDYEITYTDWGFPFYFGNCYGE